MRDRGREMVLLGCTESLREESNEFHEAVLVVSADLAAALLPDFYERKREGEGRKRERSSERGRGKGQRERKVGREGGGRDKDREKWGEREK